MTVREALRAGLLRIAAMQPPAEREAYLDILRKDGWL